MRIGLSRPGEYPEPIRAELEQLVGSLQTAWDVEHADSGRQRVTTARWNLGATQSIASATFVRLVCTRPEADNTGDITVGTDGIVRIASSGLYHVSGQVRFEAMASGLAGGQLRRNQRVMAFALGPVFSGAQVWVQVSETLPCGAGDTLEFYGLQTSGGAINVLAATTGSDHHTFLRVAKVA